MKFKPNTLGFRLILKPEGVKKMSEGGIDMSAVSLRTQAVNTDKGEVFMIGEAAWFDKPLKPDVKVGDLVFYSKYGAKTIQDPENPDEFYVLLNDEDILVGYTNEPGLTIELVEKGSYDANDGRYISEGKKAEVTS